MGAPVSLLVVCTGNTCRSAMAGVMLEHLAVRRGLALSVVTAGTHAVDGSPLGARTLSALRTIAELAPALSGRPGGSEGSGASGSSAPSDGTTRSEGPAMSAAAAHRSRQLVAGDLDRTVLVVAMETGHVRHVRRGHRDAAARTGMFRSLAHELEPGPEPLADRVAALELEDEVLDPADDVVDPAGKGEAEYDACAADLWALCCALVPRL